MEPGSNLTVAEAIERLRERIVKFGRVEENARIDRERAEAALAGLLVFLQAEGISANGSAPQPEPATPKLLGSAAVRAVMEAQPSKVWSVTEIHDELVRRDWLSGEAKYPKAGTEAAINRLWKQGVIDKHSRGRYRWADSQRRLSED